MKTISCFISYSRDSDEHILWVIHLANKLQENGVTTYLDLWDVHPGKDLMKYMETSIRESKFVILVCTPSFAGKANEGRGGVGYEKSIVTGEIFYGAGSSEKFVPILRTGTPQIALPSYLKARKYVDFRNDKRFRSSLEELLRHFLGVPKYKRPQLGAKPKLSSDKVKLPIAFKFKDIYQFANSPEGMNLSRDSAEDFTREWIDKYNDMDFRIFKAAYLFAHNLDGMNLRHQDAEDFAIEWIEQYYDKDFRVFRKVYLFAYNKDGMNLTRQDAEDFAIEWMEKYSDKDFQVFSEAYLFAYSREGLYYNHQAAEDFAFEQISKQY